MNEWPTTDSRPKLLAGSAEGYTGHVDGKLRQARMNHPKGLTVDDSGNVYVADTMNMAIRKISDTGKINKSYHHHFLLQLTLGTLCLKKSLVHKRKQIFFVFFPPFFVQEL